MRYPEVIAVPILMLLDYFLTITGAVRREKKYADYFKTQHYELNPIFQSAVGQKRWLSFKHLALTLVLSGLMAALFEFGDLPDGLVEGLLGYQFAVFGTILGRHVSNLLIFCYVERHPNEISGQVTLAHSLMLAISISQHLAVAAPLALLAWLNPTPSVLGGLAGAVSLCVHHAVWRRRYLKQSKSAKDASA